MRGRGTCCFVSILLMANIFSLHVSAGIPAKLRGAMTRILPRSAAALPKNHFGQFSLYIPFGSERLAMLNHLELDPALNSWLTTNVGESMKISNPLERAQFLSKRVERAFRYGKGGLFHPFRARRYRAMTQSGETSLLGDFIKNRTGECRHGACLLQMAYENAGIKSEFAAGRITAKFDRDGEQVFSLGHAWVEAKIADEFYIFDSVQGRHGIPVAHHISLTGEPQLFRILRTKHILERVRVEYHDLRSFNHIEPYDHTLLREADFE